MLALAALAEVKLLSNARGLASPLGACKHASNSNCMRVFPAPTKPKLVPTAMGIASPLGACNRERKCNCMRVLAAPRELVLKCAGPCHPAGRLQIRKQMQLHACVVLLFQLGVNLFSNALGPAIPLGACNNASKCYCMLVNFSQTHRALPPSLGACNQARKGICMLVLAAPAEAKLFSNAPGRASFLGACTQASSRNCMLVLASRLEAKFASKALGRAPPLGACN